MLSIRNLPGRGYWPCLLALTALTLAGADTAQPPAVPAANKPVDKKPDQTLKVYQLKNVMAQEILTANAMRAPLQNGQQRALRLAPDERGKTLFARGSAEELAQLDELLKVLDVAPDKLVKGEVAGLYLIPLSHVDGRAIGALFSQLGLRVSILPLGKRNLVVVMDPESRSDVESVVAAEEASFAEKKDAEAKPAVQAGDTTAGG